MGRATCATHLKKKMTSKTFQRMQQKSTGLLTLETAVGRPTAVSRVTKRYVPILILILWSTACLVSHSQAKKPSNTLTIQNDSGQFAVVKIVGPTRAVMKIPLDQKKKAHVTPGEYYILVRFGFAPKEYIYTKGKLFTLTQEQDRLSHTRITLHRVIPGIENPYEVSGEEFENFKNSKGKKKSRSRGTHGTDE